MVWAAMNKDQAAALHELHEANSSDRIVTVIGGALLDSAIRRALELRMRDKDGKTDMNEKLFRIGGALGNLGPKIDLGYQLYMLDKPYRNAMHGISEIRNQFAHNLSMSFDDPNEKLSASVEKMQLHSMFLRYPDPLKEGLDEFPIEKIYDTRGKFIVNLKLCLLHLRADHAKHRLWTNTPPDYVWA